MLSKLPQWGVITQNDARGKTEQKNPKQTSAARRDIREKDRNSNTGEKEGEREGKQG